MRKSLFILLSVFVSVAVSAQPRKGIDPAERMRLIDSMANPAVAESGRFMAFGQKVISTDTVFREPVTVEYRWRNTGKEAVSVMRVTASCGCVKPSFDRTPVMPGKDGSLKVTFYPEGHMGWFTYRIFVYTDLSGVRPAAVLQLKGFVKPEADASSDYPLVMGDLLLKRSFAWVTGRERQTGRIPCMNGGSGPLRIRVMKELLPPCLAFRCEPDVLEPGEEGVILIGFDPAKAPEHLPEWFPVILEGLQLPAGQRTLKLLVRPDGLEVLTDYKELENR